MKKIFILFLILFGVATSGYSQLKFRTNQLRTDSFTLDGVHWIKALSISPTLSGNSDRNIPSEKAVKSYVDAISGSGSLIDSIAKHTDSLQLHNDRLKLLEAAKHSHSNKAILDSIQIAFTTARFQELKTATLKNTQQQDSLDKHTDSLQLHNVRIKSLETAKHTHTNQSILDNTTASFTTAKDTRLTDIRDTILVAIRVTDDTLTSSEVKSGYIFGIDRELAGCTLIQVEALSPGNGNGAASIKVYRLRSGTVEPVTTAGADINGLATINTGADDVILGDYYDFGFLESGATTYTIAVDVYLKFVRP